MEAIMGAVLDCVWSPRKDGWCWPRDHSNVPDHACKHTRTHTSITQLNTTQLSRKYGVMTSVARSFQRYSLVH